MKRKTYLPKAPMANMLVDAGAERVSDGAMSEMVTALDEKGLKLAAEAVKVSRHAGRKTILAEDVRFAAGKE